MRGDDRWDGIGQRFEQRQAFAFSIEGGRAEDGKRLKEIYFFGAVEFVVVMEFSCQGALVGTGLELLEIVAVARAEVTCGVEFEVR